MPGLIFFSSLYIIKKLHTRLRNLYTRLRNGHGDNMPRHNNISLTNRLKSTAHRGVHIAWSWTRGPGRLLALRIAHRVRRNLSGRRLLSFPHLVVLFWVVILLWGERWVFGTKVQSCDWDRWENWVGGIVTS